jgi:hypothetical protein
MRYGWPPSLLVVYDEAWALVQQGSGLMADATGGNRVNMDILAWCAAAVCHNQSLALLVQHVSCVLDLLSCVTQTVVYTRRAAQTPAWCAACATVAAAASRCL